MTPYVYPPPADMRQYRRPVRFPRGVGFNHGNRPGSPQDGLKTPMAKMQLSIAAAVLRMPEKSSVHLRHSFMHGLSDVQGRRDSKQ